MMSIIAAPRYEVKTDRGQSDAVDAGYIHCYHGRICRAEHSGSLGLLEFPGDFLRGAGDGVAIDLPPGAVEVGTAMFDTGKRLRSGTIRVGGPTGVVLDVGSVPRARFAASLAACGYYGTIALPGDAEVEAALEEFYRYQSELAQRFSALAKDRTRDERKQKAIAEALMRKALGWRR
ncbi:MAG: hypothetical protein HYY32_06660 [Chloroflexi bacterium]|nr:hypothetical protein [Chloroflexota bacterium]